jgi:hypothetical protein
VSETPQHVPITDEQRERAKRATEQLKRDLAAAEQRPRPPVTSPGKFTGPLGLDASGNLQPPLTAEEAAHNEEVRRRALRADPDDEAPSAEPHG